MRRVAGIRLLVLNDALLVHLLEMGRVNRAYTAGADFSNSSGAGKPPLRLGVLGKMDSTVCIPPSLWLAAVGQAS